MSVFNTFPGNPGNATSEKDGLMSKFDKAKLDGIEKNANNYIHPVSHDASMIVESESRQFVTKEEKEKINRTLDNATTSSDGLMSSTDKRKLDGIESNANNYVHPASHDASIISQNNKMRFVTDVQIASWDAKASTDVAEAGVKDGLLSKEDKTKLDGIATNANNYVHPENHPGGMITQDSTHRFVTDTQVSKWDNKADKTLATDSLDGLMSKFDKAKLDNIEDGANKYVHPEKHDATIITQDSDHRFVSDAEKNIWNNKANTTIASSSSNGLMSKEDKTKLDGIAANANNYVHPGTHSASMITETTDKKFVTDSEKSTWNAKADKTVASGETNGLMSSTDKTKLDGIEDGANNYVHPEKHDASIITQDTTHRFVSDAEKNTWNSKPDDKVDIGLGNVTNDAQVKRSEMGKANGVATLGNDGKVPAGQLPSFVDDVVEVENYDALPETGEDGKIYVDKETNKTYRWSGSTYISIGSSLALGETSSTAYAGDKGKANADEIAKIKNGTTIVPKATDAATVSGFTVGINVPSNAKFTDTIYTHPSTHPATMITEDATHKFVTDSEKSTWNAKADKTVASGSANGLMSSADKTKLDGIASGANNYVHPANHEATIITEDSDHRFVTDEEKNTWNTKADKTIATTSANGLMSKEDKSKLDGVAPNANNYVHPVSHDATIISQDSTHRFVTDSLISKWDNKADNTVASQSKNGLMSSTDKTKLDGIASGANNYVHPLTHSATMIEQDSTHRFVSDTEKSTWNSKASADHTHPNVAVSQTNKSTNPNPNDSEFVKNAVSFDLKTNSLINNPPVQGSYSAMMSIAPGEDQSSGNGFQLLFGRGVTETAPVICIRTNTLNSTFWGKWYELYTTANKPKPGDIGAATDDHVHNATDIATDLSHRFVTDSQIASWNSKADNSIATQSKNGLMSSTDKTKLDTIESNANNYTHPASHSADMITETTDKKFVTSLQIYQWNNKADTSPVNTIKNGLMTKEDKIKLDGIATNANNYVHPSTHDATMINQDSDHRFVTDSQVNSWNNKADNTVASSTTNGLMSSTDKNTLTSLNNRVQELESNYAAILAKLKTAVFI